MTCHDGWEGKAGRVILACLHLPSCFFFLPSFSFRAQPSGAVLPVMDAEFGRRLAFKCRVAGGLGWTMTMMFGSLFVFLLCHFFFPFAIRVLVSSLRVFHDWQDKKPRDGQVLCDIFPLAAGAQARREEKGCKTRFDLMRLCAFLCVVGLLNRKGQASGR